MEDKRISCAVCAWRATCKKRYMHGDSFALHCPDFTFDLSLKKKESKEKKR
ncbi:hypothetical protein [Hippea alviniae]|uniref:hypothetical protein n=1 Tax=Hippea alviniae TaxID=1279027 RepID=UPI0003B6D91B|nr:hypothetical protein [Hippea alviniae]